jgi:hypothetical protein
MKKLSQNKINSIEQITGELPELPVKEQSDQLQRTEKWHNDRKGLVTGSRTSDLMKCDRSASKKPWGRAEKTIALGQAALDYIFEKVMERKYNKIIQTPDSFSMKYGRAAEHVIKEMIGKEIEEQGFVPVPGYEKYIGSSPDGLIKSEEKALEIKAVTNWSELRKKGIAEVNEKHDYFWQFQTEMLSLGVDKLMYVTAHPPENIFDFLNCDDPEEQKKMIGHIEVQEVHASPLHQKELLKRAIICRRIGDDYIETGDFSGAVERVLSDFEIENLEI